MQLENFCGFAFDENENNFMHIYWYQELVLVLYILVPRVSVGTLNDTYKISRKNFRGL